MAIVWRNNGEKTENGEYVADITREDGSVWQTFRANTRKEMAEKVLAAQEEGSRTIEQMKQQRVPIARPVAQAEKPLSADEKFMAASEITDPERMDSVIERVVSSKFGIPIAEVARKLKAADEKEAGEAARQETLRFVAATPDWYPTDNNKVKLFNTIQERNWAMIATNFGIVWDEMKASGVAELAPIGAEEREDPNNDELEPAPRSRPRMATTISTGIRNVDTTPRQPMPKRPKYTKNDIDNMSASVYREKMQNEQGFAALVNSLG